MSSDIIIDEIIPDNPEEILLRVKKQEKWLLAIIALLSFISGTFQFFRHNSDSGDGAYRAGYFVGTIITPCIMSIIAGMLLSTVFSLIPYKNLRYGQKFTRTGLIIALIISCIIFISSIMILISHLVIRTP